LVASIESDGKQRIERSLSERSRADHASWDYQRTDIRSFQEQAKAFEKALELWGRIDYVYANAGVGEKSAWLATDSYSNEQFVAPDLNVGLPDDAGNENSLS
jgi:NAD(P)-dependent dehydrogenase (short-subunit alcohol dehydrogenase family)